MTSVNSGWGTFKVFITGLPWYKLTGPMVLNLAFEILAFYNLKMLIENDVIPQRMIMFYVGGMALAGFICWYNTKRKRAKQKQ